MSRRTGLTLTEVLLSVLIGAIVASAVSNTISLVLRATQTSLQKLAARESAMRVLNFLEPRVMACGLGLWGCPTIHKARLAFGSGDRSPEMTLDIAIWDSQSIPIRIYERSSPNSTVWVSLRDDQKVEDDGIVFRGECLSLLYAMPTGVFLASDDQVSFTTMVPGKEEVFRIIPGLDDNGEPYDSPKDAFNGSFTDAIINKFNNDIRSWAVVPSIGLPVFIYDLNLYTYPNNRIILKLSGGTELPNGSVTVPQIAELYRLRCQRFYVALDKPEFYYQDMGLGWRTGVAYPRENNILALWFELRLKERRLDAWVLASGGNSLSAHNSRPKTWPEAAPWKESFEKHTLYVARESWRLDNLRLDE